MRLPRIPVLWITTGLAGSGDGGGSGIFKKRAFFGGTMSSHHGNAKTGTLVALTVLSLFALGGVSVAQGTGTVIGTVHDQTGAAIVGAAIKIRNTQTDVSRTVSCDTSGYY